MIAGSARFQAALGLSHQVASRVRFLGGTGATITTVTQGKVVADETAQIRRNCNVTLVDPTLVPTSTSSPLAPYGTEIAIDRGIRFADGTIEYIPQGIFGIDKVTISEGKGAGAGIRSGSGTGAQTGAFSIQVEGMDRSRKIARAAFTDHYVIASGTNLGTAIASIITSRYPAAVLSFTPTAQTVGLQVFDAGADPWKACVDLAAAGGMEVFVDPYGTFILQPVPDPLTAAISATYTEGPNSTFDDVSRVLDDGTTYNYITVSGESPTTGAPPWAVAQDTQVGSPTNVNGPYGLVVKSIVDRTLTSVAQAQARATAELNRGLGLAEAAKLSGVLHPGHTPGDVVQVTRVRSGINTFRYAVGSVTVPLEPSLPVNLSLRRRSA